MDGSNPEYWPEDDDKTFYIAHEASLADILQRAQAKWPGCTPDQLTISAIYEHTHCLGYDLYDSGDYTNFLCISKTGN